MKRIISLILSLVIVSSGALVSLPIGAADNAGTWAKQVSAGCEHTMAINTNGELWAWGLNVYGQLGDGTTDDRYSPVKIMDDVVSVSAGEYHTMAIKTNGDLWAWGMNSSSQLGDGSTTDKLSPVKIMEDVESVSAGSSHTMAINAGGELWSWGYNGSGQLGDGSTAQYKLIPVKIMDDVASVSAGSGHTMAIKAGGELWSWGRNEYGQLGENPYVMRKIWGDLVPVFVEAFDVSKTATGYQLSASLKKFEDIPVTANGWFAVYDDKKLVGMKRINVDLTATSTQSVLETITISDNVTIAKFFIWNNAMVPLTEPKQQPFGGI